MSALEKEVELKGAQYADAFFQNSFQEQEVSSLYKASSVPHLHSKSSKNLLAGSQSRKKTSEANALPDPLLFAQLRHENQLLKDRLIKEEEEKKQIVSINHHWDAQYSSLNQKVLQTEQECKQLKEEVATRNKELVTKDKQIARLTKKLELLIVNSCDEEVEKPLWKRVDERNGQNVDNDIFETLRKTEQLMSEERDGRKLAMQQLQDFKLKCDYLENILTQQTQQRMYLQNELKRLSTAIEQKATISENDGKKPSNFEDTVTGRNNSNKDLVEGHNIDLLKQQLQVYAEDFNAEKEEKQKLLIENQELKGKLSMFIEEKENLIKQLQMYEEDFQREREKRINLMRGKTTSSAESFQSARSHSSAPAFSGEDDKQQKWKEYCCLIVEREQISDRINELESEGVARYNGRGSSNSMYQSSSARGRLHSSSSTQPPANMREDLVRDGRNAWPEAMYMSANRPSAGMKNLKNFNPRRSTFSNFRNFPDEI